jgi:Cupin-like domain
MGISTRSVDTVCDIARRSNLSYDDFAREYLFANKPVVIADGLSEWNAVKTWSPAYFRRRFKGRPVEIDGIEMTVDDFVDLVLSATEENPAPYLIGTGAGKYFLDQFPELSADIIPVPEYVLPNWLGEKFMLGAVGRRLNRGPKAEIFFGGKGSGFPVLHWDSLYFHAFNGQVYGEKKWYLFDPEQTEFLYPKLADSNQSDVQNVTDPDLKRFPLFSKAKRYEFTLCPGELLFIPAGWWHTTRIECPSISIAINSANASNWSGLRSELAKSAKAKKPLLAWPLDFYLRSIQRKRTSQDQKTYPSHMSHKHQT